MTHYRANQGVLSQKNAQIFGEFLDELEATLGRGPTTEDVVKAAKPKRSPIHHLFEWDNEIAGHKYRISRARTLILAIVVLEEEEDKVYKKFSPKARLSTYENSTTAQSPYLLRKDILKNKTYRAELVRRARLELESWCVRYQDVKELEEATSWLKKYTSNVISIPKRKTTQKKKGAVR